MKPTHLLTPSPGGVPKSGETSPVAILLSIVLGGIALFFAFGAVGFAVMSLAALAGRATAGEIATILGIAAFSFAIAVACVYGIVCLIRRG